MIYSKHRFTLDMQVAHSQIAIPVTVGDTGKIFYISLTDGGEPYVITDGSLAMLTIHRPTGTYLQAFCPIKNNSTIVYDFLQNENTAVVEGIHNCELTLYGPTTEGVISTSWFTMVVNPRVVNSDNLILTDENRTAIDAVLAAEASRQTNEQARIAAESARVNAENGRVAAEKEREAYYEEFVGRVNNGEFDGAPDVVTYMNGKYTGAIKAAATLTFDTLEGIGLGVKDGKVFIGIDPLTFPEDLKGNGGSGLPEVTEADNGKIPMVVAGQWENVDFPAGTQYEVNNMIVPASSWVDNGSMIHAVVYGFEKNLDGCHVGVFVSASATKDQIAEMARCGIMGRTATGTEITLEALYAIPEIDLPFDFVITKPTTLAYSVDEESMTLTIVEGDGNE